MRKTDGKYKVSEKMPTVEMWAAIGEVHTRRWLALLIVCGKFCVLSWIYGMLCSIWHFFLLGKNWWRAWHFSGRCNNWGPTFNAEIIQLYSEILFIIYFLDCRLKLQTLQRDIDLIHNSHREGMSKDTNLACIWKPMYNI